MRFKLFLIGIIIPFLSFAQDKISGLVVDANNEPLIGVGITVEGTSRGIITDIDGRFVLEAKKGQLLIFSYVGFQQKKIEVTDSKNIVITLLPNVNVLDETVVIGYGTQSKRNVTGAISKIEMSATENLPNTSVTQTLRGRVAGVQFTDNGRPGQNGTILIRGSRSLNGSLTPLIVLDGTIYNGVISDINPNDIQSMEVLKDASASAIYGSRAANGVILITSKKGKSDKPSINFNMMYGISEAGHTPKLLSPERYIQKTLDFRREAGLEYDIDQVASYLAPNEATNYENGVTIDPWDFGTQDASTQIYDINIAGKTDRTNYFISGAYTNEKGIILNDQQNKLTFRVNLDLKITDWLKFGTNSSFARRDYSGVKANMESLMQASPYGSLYNEDGTPRQYLVDGENVAGNPLYNASNQKLENIQQNLFATFYADVKLPFLEGFNYRVNFSPNVRWTHSYNFTSQDANRTDNMKKAGKSNSNYYDWMLENIISYSKELDRNNFFDVTLLYSREGTDFESSTASSSLLSTDAVDWNNLGLGEIQTSSSSGQKTAGVSYMFRANYRLLNRYLATFTIRRDGSSMFAKNHKYATFPSGALTWIMSEENFIQNVKAIDLLKLRLSYGALGNQALSPYQSLAKLGTVKYIFGQKPTTAIGFYPNRMANDDLKWETTYTANVGLDFSLFNNRIAGSVEFYDMKTTDLLMSRTLPRMTGFTSIMTNLGEVNNRGFELSLSTINLKLKDFEWSTDFTFSYNRNKIVHLYGSDTDGDGKEDDDISNGWFIGQPISSYYDYVFDGIYQEGDELPLGYKAGYVKLKDLNGDGEITADADRTIVGNGEAKYRWGINNTFKYKDFTLSCFINSMEGWIAPFNLIGRGPVDRSLNFIDAGWWTPENKSNTRPSLMHENKYGHSWYSKRDFVRIQDISLSYNVPRKVLDKIGVSKLTLSVSGKNLYTFTDWLGSDPESGVSSREMYPMPRTISFGLNLGF